MTPTVFLFRPKDRLGFNAQSWNPALAQASLLIPILSPSTYVSPLAVVRFNMAPFISLKYGIYKGTRRMKLLDFVRVRQLWYVCILRLNPSFKQDYKVFVPTTSYGAYMTVGSRSFYVNLGVERRYNPFEHKMQTVPINTPAFKVSKNVTIELPLGDLTKHIVEETVIKSGPHRRWMPLLKQPLKY